MVNMYQSLIASCPLRPWKQGHIVANTLLPVKFLGLCKLGNICCGHKRFLNKIRNIFLCPGHKICVHNKCCARARGQTGKYLCRTQCVRSNVSSFARAFIYKYSVCLSVLKLAPAEYATDALNSN